MRRFDLSRLRVRPLFALAQRLLRPNRDPPYSDREWPYEISPGNPGGANALCLEPTRLHIRTNKALEILGAPEPSETRVNSCRKERSPGKPTTRRYSREKAAVRMLRSLRVELATEHGTGATGGASDGYDMGRVQGAPGQHGRRVRRERTAESSGSKILSRTPKLNRANEI
jgi:transposase